VAEHHRTDRRGPVQAPRAAREPAGGHAAVEIIARRVHQPDPRRHRAPRAYGLKNRERTNRLLMLMQLHANHQDDVNACTRHIRQRLEANQGARPSLDRRAVADTGKAASLR